MLQRCAKNRTCYPNCRLPHWISQHICACKPQNCTSKMFIHNSIFINFSSNLTSIASRFTYRQPSLSNLRKQRQIAEAHMQANDQTGAIKSSPIFSKSFIKSILTSFITNFNNIFKLYLLHGPCPFVLQIFSNHLTSLAEERSGHHTAS